MHTRLLTQARPPLTQALPWHWCAWGIAQRAALCLALFAVAAPGLLAWMPVWVYVKRRERLVMRNGPRWNDRFTLTPNPNP